MGNCCSRPDFTPITILRGKKTTSSEKFEQFTGLPDDLARQVFNDPSFSMKDKVALARTSKRYYGLFRDHIHDTKCLMLVAHGEQKAASYMLRRNPQLLLERRDVTDYSGRTFKNITAYEYAYWAKDTHMCRMLEAHMDEATKANILERIDEMERDGLTYEQHGVVVEHSKHFDFTPLITALTLYVQGFDNWSATSNWDAMRAAWMKVGLAQRDLPVHVVNEYCHSDRSFDPRPTFNEETLPRYLTFYNYITGVASTWFPLVVSDSAGLGVDFAVVVGGRWLVSGASGPEALLGPLARVDLVAVSHLGEVRTADLTLSRENLQPRGPERMLS